MNFLLLNQNKNYYKLTIFILSMVEYVSVDDVDTQIKIKKQVKRSINMSFVLPLMSVNVVFFLLGSIFPSFYSSLVLVPAFAFSRPWTLLTTVFMHAGLEHLFFNMIVLFFFGSFLEKIVGPKRFISMYLIIGVLVSIIASFFYEPMSTLLGASGALMGVIGTLIVLNPNAKVLLYFIIPMKLWMLGILVFFLDFLGMFYQSGVANFAHIIGLFLGLIYGFYLHNEKKKYFKKFNLRKEVNSDEIK